MIGVTNLNVYKSVFNKTKHNNRLAIYTTGYWEDLENIKRLDGWIGERKLNEIDLHVEEVNERGMEIKTGESEYQLFELDNIYRRNEILETSEN